MPYKSEAQRRYLHAKNPKLAKRWDREYPASARSKNLPERVRKRRKK